MSNSNLTAPLHSSNSHYSDASTKKSVNTNKETHCIYPGDLYPFLRKPLFLIVDSYQSNVFKNFPNLFSQPFVALLSPSSTPSQFNGWSFKIILFNTSNLTILNYYRASQS